MMDAPVVTVEPGFTVEARITEGVHGESEELALSLEWRDAEGCLWAADFSEDALALAELHDATISLRDMEGANMVFRLYEPVKQIALTTSWGE
jgi:sugar phosphate isomerase/epimerase